MNSQNLSDDFAKAYEDSIGVIWAEAQKQLQLSNDNLVLKDLIVEEDLIVNIVPETSIKKNELWYLDRYIEVGEVDEENKLELTNKILEEIK